MKRPEGISEELAEVIGLLLGDGCMGRYHSNGRTNYQIAFTASAREFPYYQNFVKPTFRSIFGVEDHLYPRNDNTTRYHIYNKELVDYIATMGIPVGKKLDASIPPPVFEQEQVVPFIRGLYHAEGSIYRRYSKAYNRHPVVYNNLLVIQIRMKLRTLMHEVHDELTGMGIICNKLAEKDGVYTLRITTQAEISKFLLIVRPKLKDRPPPITLLSHQRPAKA